MAKVQKSIRSRLYELGQRDAAKDYARGVRRRRPADNPWWSRGYNSTILELEHEARMEAAAA